MNHTTGIIATLDELIRARPPKNMTGFAPSGKVSTHQWGSNASVFKGRGMEFAESRAYQPGDDVRNIDWRVTARTGETHTKLFQEERERPIQILLDVRPMMHFGTRVRFKSHLAAEIAAQLSWVAYDGGDRLGGHILTGQGAQAFRAARTRRAVLRFLEAISVATVLKQPTQDDDLLPLSSGINRLRRVSRPGTLVFVISDFNDMDDDTAQALSRLSLHTQVTCIQVIDPLDMALPSNAGNMTDGKQLLALSSLNHDDFGMYHHAFIERQNCLARLCAKHRMTYHQVKTTDTAQSLLQPSEHRSSV